MLSFNPFTGTFDDKGTPFNPAVPGAIGGTTPAAISATTLANSGLHTTTIGAVNTPAWTATGYSLTGSDASCMVDLSGTWNTSGAPTAFKLALTDTASANNSDIFNFQYGATPSYVRFRKLTGSTSTLSIGGTGASIRVFEGVQTTPRFLIGGTTIAVAGGCFLNFSGTTHDASAAAVLGFYKEDTGTLALCNGSTLSSYRDMKMRKLHLDATMTAAGTTGARTIDKGAGAVNFAAGATSLVVTNNQVTTASIILAMVDDAAAVHVQRVVAGTGSFTIYLNTTAGEEVAVKWIVINGTTAA